MKNAALILFSFLILLCLDDCRKNNTLKPELRLSTEAGFIHANSIVSKGTTVMVRIYAESDGEDMLARLVIYKNEEILLDSNIQKKNLFFDMAITKDQEIEESWEFLVRDEGSEESSQRIILFAKAGIRGFQSPAIGAQQSSGDKFYSIMHNHAYIQEDASMKYDSVDLMYYYNAGNSSAFLIGASNKIADTLFTGPTAPISWTSRNNTLFLPATNISAAVFDTLTTDWFLKYAFQRKKSDWTNQSVSLEPDVMAYFKLASGEYGLCRVASIDKSTTGSVILDIKMQDFN